MPLEHLLAEPITDPLPLYRARDSIYAVDLLAAAIVHLDLFTWLAEHPATFGAICQHFEIQPRPADVMMTLCSAMGLVVQSGGVFLLTARAREHLVASSPFNLAPYYNSLRNRPQILDMVKVLRTGKTANWGSYDASAWAASMERPDFAAQFTSAMDCRGYYLGPALAKKVDLTSAQRLLDIGGGSGIYACCFAARYPELQAAVFEKPPVDRIAREAIAKQGASDRVEVIAGDKFAGPLPGGFDVHLISNVLHDWDEAVVREILAKSHAALTPGGLLVVHDEHINADKTGPLPVAQYSCQLMHSTEGKCYSLGEMRAYFSELGFDWVSFSDTAADRSAIVARKG
jgi:SAM-dependent methyltransferase